VANLVLVLNTSYEFLNLASLKRALKLIIKGKAEVVESHPEREVASPSVRLKAPAIIRMLYYIVRPFKQVPLTKKNIMMRDKFTCQYCGKYGSTVDHIIPRSRGGKETWGNCVCACNYCNTRKNNRTPAEAKMKLRRKPRKPKYIPWMLTKSGIDPGKWERYLF